MVYVPLLVNRFQKSVLLIVQYKYLKFCSGDFILQNLILRTISCGTGFITEPSWLLHFQPTKMVGRKCFVPPRYQLQRGISGRPALKYLCMIHRVGRLGTCCRVAFTSAQVCALACILGSVECELLCFIEPIPGNHWARGFLKDEPRSTHPRSLFPWVRQPNSFT